MTPKGKMPPEGRPQLCGPIELPDDMEDAFESFKLAILGHNLSGWIDVSSDTVMRAIGELARLVLSGAPIKSAKPEDEPC